MQSKVFQKFLIATVAGFLLCGASAVAQQATPPTAPEAAQKAGARDMVDMRLQRMSQHLNLTEEQKSRLTPILKNEAEQARAIRQDTSLTPDQRRAKVKELRQSTRAQIETILTAEQRQKMATFAAQRGQGMHPGRGMGMNATPNMDRLSKELNLTDEQKAKLQPLFEEHRKQMQSIWQDTSLTPEQKRAKAKELRQSHHQQMMAVLTPEQQQKFQQMRANRPHKRGYGQGMGPDKQPAPPSPPQM